MVGEEHVPLEAVADTAGHGVSALETRFWQENRKFVAPESGDNVGFAGAGPNDRRRLDEGAAAQKMPVDVVDLFESVQVHKKERERPSAAGRALGFLAKRVVQVARVIQLSQIVGDR